MKTSLLISTLLLLQSTGISQQIKLDPWTEVKGKIAGTSLGRFVSGVESTAALPYRAAVSSNGRTYFYRLQSPNDTVPQFSIKGDHALFGDLNGDGWTDVVTLVTINDIDHDTVLIYWGAETHLDTITPLQILGEFAHDRFQPGTIGDVDNDGRDDLVLLAPDYSGWDAGKVYIYLNPVTEAIPDGTITGDGLRAGLGYGVAIDDINNDGFNDLIVSGSDQNLDPLKRSDYVNIYWGNGGGTINLMLGVRMKGENLVRPGMACFDVNGDGISDLLWNTRSFAYPSSPDFISVHFGQAAFDTIPSLRLLRPGLGNFGRCIINAGDMNGDGYDDIAVSAPDATNWDGFVWVFAGGPKIDSVFDAAIGYSDDSYFGTGLSGVGDLNHDGFDDLIIGAPEYYFGNQEGYWGIYLGDSAIRVTDVADQQSRPHNFTLYQCYPNPFNPMTSIRYDLDEGGSVSLEVTNLLGQKVAVLVNENQGPGSHSATFDGTNYPSGAYLYTLRYRPIEGPVRVQTKKLTLVK